MSKINKMVFAKALCAFFSCMLACLSFPALAAELSSPAVTASDFYEWYIHSLVTDHQPLRDEKVKLGTYVSPSLMAEIEKRMNSEDGLDADYFIQAQDYHDDWEKNISVTKSRKYRNSSCHAWSKQRKHPPPGADFEKRRQRLENSQSSTIIENDGAESAIALVELADEVASDATKVACEASRAAGCAVSTPVTFPT